MAICAVVLAGGTGSRLWPSSRAGHPKQFLSLHRSGSMLQETFARLKNLEISQNITICNEEHRFFVAEQLRSIDQLGTVILEPAGRNTAPAIALASLSVEQEDPVLLILAADHIIENVESFEAAVGEAAQIAESGKLVTFGVVPKEAHAGYGYIKKGEPEARGYKIKKFEEKPSLATAQSYLDSGDYLWNSGMFMFRASVYLAELERHRPDIAAACRNAMDNAQADLDFLRIDQHTFGQCPSDSIDYAVMEKTDKSVVVPLDAGWTDIGSWSSLWEVSEKDEQGNSVKGDAIVLDAKNSYIRSEDKLVAAIGIDGLVIVNTKDALLVATQNRVQDVKNVTEQLKAEARAEWELHREVYRPWGKYDSVDSGERYQVKRITVDPGAKLSVQMHHHRAEHWVVVSGCARVTKGEETFLLSENQSTYIPIGEVHSLENPGKVALEIVEIQSGSYLDEDDIVRLDDRYGR